MHVICDNQYKTGADGGSTSEQGNIFGQPMLFECMGICVLSPAHEREMRGYLVYLLIVKYLSILFKYNHSILDWTALSLNCGWGWRVKKKTFLVGSVDHIICRDYIVNRSSFIYCSLATKYSAGQQAYVGETSEGESWCAGQRENYS